MTNFSSKDKRDEFLDVLPFRIPTRLSPISPSPTTKESTASDCRWRCFGVDSDLHLEQPMAFPERRTADVLLTILFFAVVCASLYTARRIILIFVLAVFFAYLIDPVVKFLQRHSLFFRNLRGPAVVEVYLASVILIAALGYALAPGLARNTVKLVDEVPVLLDGLSTGDIAAELGGEYGWSDEQEFRFRAFLARHREDIQGLVRSVDHYLSKAAQVLGGL